MSSRVLATGGFGAANWAVLAAYLLVLVGMGAYFSRREKSTEDFFLAGRRIPWWAAGLSIVGTGLSAMTFMSVPAFAYRENWTYYVGAIVPVLLIPFVVAFYLPFYRRLNVTTAYEYLERRFNTVSRLVGTCFYISYELLRMALVLYLPALALAMVTKTDVSYCILAMGVLCIVYTVMGGIEAVIWTDVLQVVVLLGAAVLSLCLIGAGVDGGLARVFSESMAQGKFRMANPGWDPAGEVLWVIVLGSFFSNLMPNTAHQGVIQRYLAVRDLKAARRAAWVNGLSAVPIVALFLALGTALWMFYKVQNPGLLPRDLDAESIFPFFVTQQMPAGVAGLVVAGLFAAAMSSLDSGMNSIATVITTDVYRRFSRRADDRSALRLARCVTALSGVAGTGAALIMVAYSHQIGSVWRLFLKVLGLTGGALAGMFVLGIFTRRTHGVGVCIGAAAGSAAAIAAWRFNLCNGLLFGALGVGVCVVVGYGASLVLPAGGKDLAGLTIHTVGRKAESTLL